MLWTFNTSTMSGHSKWSQIKHKKGAADAKKSVLFGKLSNAIAAAVQGDPSPTSNLRLRREIDQARRVNMSRESIDRAIERGTRLTGNR
jgi:transcriptional/translational regulatory protein YebC/TACO1